MARQKATITLDRGKVDTARELTGKRSASEVIDLALDRLIAHENVAHDLQAYSGRPQSSDELATADLAVMFDLDDEDTDYDAMYG